MIGAILSEAGEKAGQGLWQIAAASVNARGAPAMPTAPALPESAATVGWFRLEHWALRERSREDRFWTATFTTN
jgi:hypothetical protein